MAVKRLNYFTHQLLREQDFHDEQDYQIQARRRHNRSFHAWGVVEGLEVQQQGREVSIEPGIAVDRDGREIVLEEKVTRDLSSFSADSDAYITIGYHEEMEDTDHVSAGGVEGYTRITEAAEIQERRHEHLDEGVIVLARVRVGQHGRIQDVDMSQAVRKSATAHTAPRGWMRLPFKPVRLNPVRWDRELAPDDSAEFDFIIDEANAYCGSQGARGSMQVPVPPGVSHISGFRVAGTTKGEVIARLFRTGWNMVDGKGEKTQLAEETLSPGAFFKEVELNQHLDESHALAVSIRAEEETHIWLIAVKFH